jgi:type IV pilus assembly protein PilN
MPVMKIPINLSSEPFRRDRPLIVGSAALAAVLAVLLGIMVFLIFAQRERVKDTRAAVDRFEAQVRDLTAQQAKLDSKLREPANAQVLQRSLLLNTLLERKSISWTRIFADLEGVMPYEVRLISVRLPQITSQNEVVLDVQVGSKSPEQVIDFLVRLRKSPLFGPVDLKSTQPPTQQEPIYKYRFTVNYAQKL